MRGPAAQTSPAAVASIADSGREELGKLQPEALASEGRADDEDVAGRRVPGSARECAGVRQSRQRKDAPPMLDRPGTHRAGATRLLHDVSAAGAGSAGSQARSEAEPLLQTAGVLRGTHHR